MSLARNHPSLLKLLTLPFLAVVLILAAVVAALSYRAATLAVDEPAQQWLSATVQRIGDVIDRQQVAADAQLLAAFPEGSFLSEGFEDDVEVLRMRMWLALRLHPEAADTLSAVNRRGQAISIRRLSATDAEMQLQLEPGLAPTRQVFSVASKSSAGAAMAEGSAGAPRVESTPQEVAQGVTRLWGRSEASDPTDDARHLAWYRVALQTGRAAWTSTQVDPGGTTLTLLRARPVRAVEDTAGAAAAASVPLKPLQEALLSLKLPPRGVAVVVDRDGQLVASSASPVVQRAADGSAQRVTIHMSGSPLLVSAYERLLPQLGGRSMAQPGTLSLGDGQTPVLASFGRITDGAGYDWAVIVAAPRSDFTSELMTNVAHTAAAALVAMAGVLVLGAWVRRRMSRDALILSTTLQAIADGDLETPPGTMRSAEMTSLREALHRMQLRLRTDRVTGLANREAILNRLHDRMRPGRRHNDAPLLALLFVDLDRFKSVNERHGHETGDFVLQTIGRRLRQTVRDTDLVARWAGDEFVVLLDGVGTPQHAQRARDQVERVLRDLVELGPGRDGVELDGTVGLALSPADATDPEALLRAAEEDMLQRKPASLSQW